MVGRRNFLRWDYGVSWTNPSPCFSDTCGVVKDLSKRIQAAKTANAKEFVDPSLIEEPDRSGYIDGLWQYKEMEHWSYGELE